MFSAHFNSAFTNTMNDIHYVCRSVRPSSASPSGKPSGAPVASLQGHYAQQVSVILSWSLFSVL